MDKTQRTKEAMRVSRLSIWVNVALAAVKLLEGIFCASAALVSDAWHSLSDVFSTAVVMVGVKIGAQSEDDDHPYGHEKFEAVAGTLLAVILFLAAVYIGYSAVVKIPEALRGELPAPGLWAVGAAALSIVVKEWMYRFTVRAAERLQSCALKADAWHHRSDALSSVGSLIGVLGAVLGATVLDPIASLVIAVFILKVAVDVFRESVRQTVDRAADAETVAEIRAAVLAVPGVEELDGLKTRMHASLLFVDAEILVAREKTFPEAHDIAEAVHAAIEEDFPNVKHCMVHASPCEE